MLNSVCVGCILLTAMEFQIKRTWDSLPVAHKPVKIRFSPGEDGLLMQVTAPFFNDPPAPAGPPGEPFPGLWDYEGKFICTFNKGTFFVSFGLEIEFLIFRWVDDKVVQ